MANDTQTVGGKTDIAFAKPTITAGAYSANDAVGQVVSFKVGSGTRKSGIIVAATLLDMDSEAAATDLFLFSHNVTSVADNAAFAPTDAEILRCIGVVNFGTSDYASAGNGSVAQLSGLSIPFVCPRGSLGISNVAASGSLIAITTLTAHGLSTGARVWVENVSGVSVPSTDAGWPITVTSSTAFTLDNSTHSGTYVTGTGEVRVSKEEKNYHIYGQLVARGTPTYTAVTDLAVKLHILQD